MKVKGKGQAAWKDLKGTRKPSDKNTTNVAVCPNVCVYYGQVRVLFRECVRILQDPLLECVRFLQDLLWENSIRCGVLDGLRGVGGLVSHATRGVGGFRGWCTDNATTKLGTCQSLGD